MSVLAIVGIPRTHYTLYESVFQAFRRGLDVLLVDRASCLDACPSDLPVVKKLAVENLSGEAATTALRPTFPQFVLSFTEFGLIVAAEVRYRLGLNGPSLELENMICRKNLTRRRLCERGLSSIRFKCTTLEGLPKDTLNFTQPFVVKPINLTGSLGVHGVRNASELPLFNAVFADLEVERKRDRELLIEEFITGEEYSVEGICVGGCLYPLALTRKRTTGFPHFVEVGHTLPADISTLDVDCFAYVQKVIDALGIDTAPIHAEIKIDGPRIELVEIHTRFGGDYIPLLLEKAFDYKVFGMYYDALLFGKRPELYPASRIAGIQFIHPEDLDTTSLHLRQWEKIPYSIHMEPGSVGVSPHSFDNIRAALSRIGYLIFCAPDMNSADGFVRWISRAEPRPL